MDSSEKQYHEQKIIKYTIFINLVGSIFCFWIGLKNHSTAMVFDTAYCLLLTVGYYFILRLSRKRVHKISSDFPFGFAKLHPIISIFQALLILMACILAIVNMVFQIINQQFIENFTEIIIFQSIFLSVCIITYWNIKRYCKKYKSKVLKIILLNWSLDIYQAAIFVVSFGIGDILSKTSYHNFSHYIDPLALIILILIIISEPLKIIHHSFIELLDGNANPTIHNHLKNEINQIVKKYPLFIEIDNINIRTSGEKIFIYVVLKEDALFSSQDLQKLLMNFRKQLKLPSYQIEIMIGLLKQF